MPDSNYPLLLFPSPSVADRNKRGRGSQKFERPSHDRQVSRIAPKFASLQATFEAERLRLLQVAPAENPEFVLVFETIGTIENFAKAVSTITGLEWLFEAVLAEVVPDKDFHVKDEPEKVLSGRLFLLGTNQQALKEILSLWEIFKKDPLLKFPKGQAPWKHVFKQLKDVRRWGVQDRVGADVTAYWQEQVAGAPQSVKFEIEAWCFHSAEKNSDVNTKISGLVHAYGGAVLSSALLTEIGYHGFLVEIPAAFVQRILAGEQSDLILSDRILYFRPRAQAIFSHEPSTEAMPAPEIEKVVSGLPTVALLDGLPLQNHSLLNGRIIIDDPDGWAATYEAKDRVHGTAMASLIAHGELDTASEPLSRPIYVRPVLRADPTDPWPQRAERTPTDILLIDLIHRAVRRICEGEAGQAPAAPSVKVINLSIGDEHRIFDREMSPWAKLLDWLSYKYGVLFIVSAGNCDASLHLDTLGVAFSDLTSDDRSTLAMRALLSSDVDRRLIAPAEAINVLTVGALHSDTSQPVVAPNRFDLFDSNGLSPYSRIGHGFRRAVKPDILMPGGRILHRQALVQQQDLVSVETINMPAAPGHRVAAPPIPGLPNSTNYCRGTSNAAALVSRAAAQAADIIDQLRADMPQALPADRDALLIKALLAHGAGWGDWPIRLLSLRSEITNWRAQREFVARWLGYGPIDIERSLGCTAQRATLLGVGEVGKDEAIIFQAPLPPSLSATAVLRQLTVTLAWFSPANPAHHAYRKARLWTSPPQDELRVTRTECVHDHAQRGTLQHDVLEGSDAVAFVDGDKIKFKVNCAADAGDFEEKIPFALCASIEVPVGTGIPIYQEIRERIIPAIAIQPIG